MVNKEISIIGAGAIGVCSALHLQQRGWGVTLIDRSGVAKETSYGNAGIINTGSMVAVNSPDLHRSLASFLKNDKPHLRYNLKHILKNLPWALQFLQASKTRQANETTDALHSLTSVCLQEHKALMQRVGNAHRLSELGWLHVYRDDAHLNASSYEADQLKRFGIPKQKLNASELHDLEPSLNPIYAGGYLLNDGASINNPGALITEYAEQFVADGGSIVNAEIETISRVGDKVRCHTSSQKIESDALLVAAGPWSGDILKLLHYSVPLGVERGYHAHYHLNNNAALSRSVYDKQAGFIMSPMEMGLRITTGVDLDHRDAPPNHSQLNQVLPSIKEAIDLGDKTEAPIWQGNRPTLPDSKPIIGKLPNHSNVWAAFGHQHIGLMTAPITGKLIAEQISDEKSDIDTKPFSPARYVRSTVRRKPVWSSIKP